MAENRRPESPLVSTLLAWISPGVVLPPEQSWIRFDLLPRFMAAQAEVYRRWGCMLWLAAAGRSPERSLELYPSAGGLDGHVIGSALDLNYVQLCADILGIKGRSLTIDDYKALAVKLDPVTIRFGFNPLGGMRWPNADTGQRGDPNHVQTDDYSGKRQIGVQKVPSMTALQDAIWTPWPLDKCMKELPGLFV